MLARTLGIIFFLYDWCYTHWYRLNRLEARAGSIILFHLIKHSGEDIELPPGVTVKRGGEIISIHINQRRGREMQKAEGHTRLAAVKLRRDFKNSLAILAHAIATRPRYRNVRAIKGETIFSREAEYFGFKIVWKETPDIMEGLTLANAEALILRTRKSGNAHAVPVNKIRRPCTIWMSCDYLRSRYLPKP